MLTRAHLREGVFTVRGVMIQESKGRTAVSTKTTRLQSPRSRRKEYLKTYLFLSLYYPPFCVIVHTAINYQSNKTYWLIVFYKTNLLCGINSN
jgi:hypothetical protein